MLTVNPDLLTFDDGTNVEKSTWAVRRDELYKAIIPHEYGALPPESGSVEVIQLSGTRIKPDGLITYNQYEVRCSVGSGEVSFMLQTWIPEGDGPFPVILDGDGCWRYYDDHIVADVTKRGYVAASFNRTALAADNADRYRDTGLYRIYPDGEFGALAAWAWGYHRCADALETFEFVRSDQIAITGHSRGGKAVLLAGATDERIALTNPNCSGAGGSGLNRLKARGAETIADFIRGNIGFWFGNHLKAYAERDGELPYDQHFLHALVAPRFLLVTDASDDAWANPPGSYAACQAARSVYAILGRNRAIGWIFREGGHAHSPADYESLLDFADQQFRGSEPDGRFQRPHFPDIDTYFERSLP